MKPGMPAQLGLNWHGSALPGTPSIKQLRGPPQTDAKELDVLDGRPPTEV